MKHSFYSAKASMMKVRFCAVLTMSASSHDVTTPLAIRAVQDMMKSQDFDRKMLLLATQISHESENRRILLAALEALLKTLKLSKGGETVLEAMSLLRCIIKLVLRLLTEPAADKCVGCFPPLALLSLIESQTNPYRYDGGAFPDG